MVVAHSAPIYVVVDGEPSWKASAVGELVQYQRAKLEELMTAPMVPLEDLEPWETRDLLLDQWDKQRPLIKPQVDQATEAYQKLLDRFSKLAKKSRTSN